MKGWVWWAALLALIGCGQAAPTRAEQSTDGSLEGALEIKGSDTMVNLCQAWAEAFMAKHPKVSIAVTGGGSGTGIAALISGTCDLAASSRTIKPKEIAQAQSHGITPKEWMTALDGLAVVVNPKNPIKQLTVDQLADLFTGRIKNWSKLGGDNVAVVLLSREVNSGTHVYFKEHVLGSKDGQQREFASEALLLPSSQAIADEVAANPGAIGYYGMGYLNPKNAAVAVAKTAGDRYVTPMEDAVKAATYPISRPLLLYSKGEVEGVVKAFLDFVLSPEGQTIVRNTDFVPIAETAQ